MAEQLGPAEASLIQVLGATSRGPKRNGLFALWLVVRACAGLLPPDALSARAHRRRLESLIRRLSSLSLHPALRRLLVTCVRNLNAATPAAAAEALDQLAASVNDHLGPEAAAALLAASHAARDAIDQLESPGESGAKARERAERVAGVRAGV